MRREKVDNCGCLLTRTENGLHMNDCPLHAAAPAMDRALRYVLINLSLAEKAGASNGYIGLAKRAAELALPKREHQDHTEQENLTHIIIENEGGLVKAVWSTDADICVEVLDRDEPENSDDYEDWREDTIAREKDIKDKQMVDIYGY